MALALVIICDRCGRGRQSLPIPRTAKGTAAARELIREGQTTEHVCDACEPFDGPEQSRLEQRPPALPPVAKPQRWLRGYRRDRIPK